MTSQAPTKNARIKRRNEKIRKRFSNLINEKRFAIDYALELLEEEFVPLTSGTLWLIVSQTGYYKNL